MVETFCCPSCHCSTEVIKVEHDEKMAELNKIIVRRAVEEEKRNRQEIEDFNRREEIADAISKFWDTIPQKLRRKLIDARVIPERNLRLSRCSSAHPLTGLPEPEYFIACPTCGKKHYFEKTEGSHV